MSSSFATYSALADAPGLCTIETICNTREQLSRAPAAAVRQFLYLHSTSDRNENRLQRETRAGGRGGESVAEEGEEKQSLTLLTVALLVYKPTWDSGIWKMFLGYTYCKQLWTGL